MSSTETKAKEKIPKSAYHHGKCDICGQGKQVKSWKELLACASCHPLLHSISARPDMVRLVWRRLRPDEPFDVIVDAELAARDVRILLNAHPDESIEEALEREIRARVVAALPEVVPDAKSPDDDIDVAAARATVAKSPFEHILDRMAEIHRAKRQDYASHQDPLGNFREAERLSISPLQGIMVRLGDKYSRACNLVKRSGERAVRDETLEDTLLDNANYSVLAILAAREAAGQAE